MIFTPSLTLSITLYQLFKIFNIVCCSVVFFTGCNIPFCFLFYFYYKRHNDLNWPNADHIFSLILPSFLISNSSLLSSSLHIRLTTILQVTRGTHLRTQNLCHCFLTFSFSVGRLSYANLAWGKLRYYHLEQLHPGNHWLLINVVAYVAYIFLKVHLCELHVNLHNFVSSIDNFLWVLEVKVPQALSKYCDESVIPTWTLFCTG